jgi:predicted LPLAT superfamily acyltransferase
VPVAAFQRDHARMSRQWRGQPEPGSSRAMRFMIWMALHSGRTACRALLVPISAYALVTASLARRSSQAFLRRALGRRPTWRDTFLHLFVFATTVLDRVYLVNGRHHDFTVDVSNEQVFWDALAQRRGCLLLGSHLGSFEMLGIVGSVEKKLAINVVMHLEDSARLRTLLPRAGNTFPYTVIPLGQPGSMLRVKECLERGEIVGILADRVYGSERTQWLSFLGRPAQFSLSPMRLAAIADAPVVMMFGLFRGGRRYEIVFEPLGTQCFDGAEDATPPAPVRALRWYVERLEHHARDAPYNWFNFYDYWGA